jgi:hypothetical protein
MIIMFKLLVNSVIDAGSVKDIRQVLNGLSTETQVDVLKAAVDVLNKDVEVLIQGKEHQLALWSLSKLTVMEDLLIRTERHMLAVGVC